MSKITIKEVKEVVNDFGWSVASDKYVNLKTEMEFKCGNGHSVFTTFEKIRRTKENTVCPICDSNKYSNVDQISIPKKSKDKTRILAIDQASIISGWSIFDDKDLIKFGKLCINDSLPKVERFEKMREWLINIIKNAEPNVILFEDIQLQDFDKNGERINKIGVNTFKTLAELLGVCQITAFESGVECHVIHSATWRSELKITGRYRVDKKRSAQILIKNLYDVKVSEDEADAICIGLYGTTNFRKQPEMISWA